MKKACSKLFILIMSVILVLSTSGCADKQSDEDVKEGKTVNMAVLNGPTGIGAVMLMDQTEKYNVETYQAATDIVPKLISGEADVACLPSNMAAVLYNKTEGEIIEISPMVMGVLYVLGNNITDVADITDLKGKTVIASGQGGTPEYALQKILENAGLKANEDVNVEWLASHADVNTKLIMEGGTIALVPEPFVSVAKAKGGQAVSVLFDMNEEWQKAAGQAFPMGVLVAQKSFVEDNYEVLETLLNDMAESIEAVNKASTEICDLIVEKGLIGEAGIAKSAIPNCNIGLYVGEKLEEGREIMKTFNKTMFEMNPESVGGKLPDDGMYF